MLCAKCKKEYGPEDTWPNWLTQIAVLDLDQRRADNVFYDHASPLLDEVDKDD